MLRTAAIASCVLWTACGAARSEPHASETNRPERSDDARSSDRGALPGGGGDFLDVLRGGRPLTEEEARNTTALVRPSGPLGPERTLDWEGAHEAGSAAFDDGIVERQMTARSRAMRLCLRRLPATVPRGDVEVVFAITPAGRVDAMVTRDELSPSGAGEGCLAPTIGRFWFDPGPTGGASRYRYVFHIGAAAP